jgi:hypothetical protein
MVPHQRDVLPRAGERSHPVVASGEGCLVVEDDRELGVVERAVLEALRQPETDGLVPQIRDRDERPERRLRAHGVRRPRDESLERTSQHGRAGGRGRASQERTTVDPCHGTPPLGGDRHLGR